jgi:hypothetical protein
MYNFIKNCLVGVELFRADRQADGHDEANSRFSEFCERALKTQAVLVVSKDVVARYK